MVSEQFPMLASAFVVGLMGGVHCAGMCGGIVSALGANTAASRPAAGNGQAAVYPLMRTSLAGVMRLQVAYNVGRLAGYVGIGAVAGAIGATTLLFSNMLPVQHALYLIANGMMIALGLYLAGIWSGVARIERLGLWLWCPLQPVIRRFLPADTFGKGVALGALWGFVPCGMVYSMLTTAMVAGGAEQGALVMLAFGLGTLPNLLALGVAASFGRHWIKSRAVRLLAGLVVVGFGVIGFIRADALVQQQGGWFCTVGH